MCILWVFVSVKCLIKSTKPNFQLCRCILNVLLLLLLLHTFAFCLIGLLSVIMQFRLCIPEKSLGISAARLFMGLSLSSARQHPSYGDCLEVKREYYQNSSVQDCVTQCSQSAAHLYEQFLQVKQIGFVTLGPLHCV